MRNNLVGELVDGISFTFHLFTADLVVLAVDALEIAVGEEDVDDGVERGFLAAVEYDGGHLEVGGGPAEA